MIQCIALLYFDNYYHMHNGYNNLCTLHYHHDSKLYLIHTAIIILLSDANCAEVVTQGVYIVVVSQLINNFERSAACLYHKNIDLTLY